MEIHSPRNTQAVELYYRGEKMAKVRGVFYQSFMSICKLCGLLTVCDFFTFCVGEDSCIVGEHISVKFTTL